MFRIVSFLVLISLVIYGAAYKLREVPAFARFFSGDANAVEKEFAWPPQLGDEYPDLKLVDQTGSTIRLSELRGKVILVELIGMPCGACQAFAGAHRFGVFGGGKLQADLESIEAYARRFGDFDLKDDRVVYVQLLLFNDEIQAPTAEDVRDWAEHFGMDRSRNQIVLAGTERLATPLSYKMIPGFHLIDRDFVLRRDSSGHQPVHNLYDNLLPAMGRLIANAR